MRYLHLFLLFLKNSLQIDLEYRANFVGALIFSVLDLVWSVGGTVLFYSFRDRIGGWSFYEALLVIGLFFLMLGVIDIALLPNVQGMGDHIRKGTFDFVLVKPLNSQLHGTLRLFKVHRMSSVFSGIGILVFALAKLQIAPNFGQITLFFLIGLCAIVMVYSILTMLSTVAFWTVAIDNIHELFFAFLDAAKYPASAFPEPLHGIIMFIIPVGFMTTVPAQVLLNRITPSLVLYGVVLAALLLAASISLWRVAVRNYSSASS